ncbi:UNVERIFIED_ORG: hypothetical protein GGI63_003286 [Rhizobium esperanzae]|nr:hypothetical protein RHECNPAF_1260080 [Rhizobium etli CNPAF512]
MTYESVPAPSPSGYPYVAGQIILYGVDLNDANQVATLDVGLPGQTALQIQLGGPTKITGSTVLAYGYAFDGHCYRFDSIRIFIVTGPNPEPPVGCCFDQVPGYQMWRIGSAEQILEISTNFGDAKTLILDSQLPGKRSPTSYAITLRMAHRNGRLSND